MDSAAAGSDDAPDVDPEPDVPFPELLLPEFPHPANAPVAIRNAKAAIRRFTGAALAWDLGYEADMFGACFATQDQKNAMQAFMDKTDRPEFTGR